MFAGNEEAGQTYKHIDFFVGAKNTVCVGATGAARARVRPRLTASPTSASSAR